MSDAPATEHTEEPQDEREGGEEKSTERPSGVSESRDSTGVDPQEPGEDAPYLQTP